MSDPTPAPTPGAPPPEVPPAPPATEAAAPSPLDETVAPPAPPAEEKAPAEKPVEEKKPDEPVKAPVELKVPEGVTVDEAVLTDFKTKAGELGLDGAKAQGLLDFYLGVEKARAQADEAAFIAQSNKWLAEAKADPDIGGPKWDESAAAMRRALNHFQARPAVELLSKAGLSNHPEILRLFTRLGRAVGEDTVAGAARSAPRAPDDILKSFYPTMHKDKES